MNKSASNLVEETVRNALEKTAIRSPLIILGVSGGADSMALLYTLHKLKTRVLGVHINYGLRENESDLDQELVEGMCFEWGFDCCAIRLDEKQETGNFQNWARNERYRIFNELKEEFEADYLATGHHQDDQIETIFHKIMRGSSPNAWKGMEEWNGEVLRPFIKLSKQDILNYCTTHSIPFRTDGSNMESNYARNFFRHDLVERMSDFFPGWRQNLLQVSELGMISEAAVSALLSEFLVENGLLITKIKPLSKELRISIIKKYIDEYVSFWKSSKGLLDELEGLINSQPGKNVQISEKHLFIRERDTLFLKKISDKEDSFLSITKEELSDPKNFKYISLSLTSTLDAKNDIYIDASKIVWPITIRTWRKGDKFTPLGMKGTQKISDHLTNRKISSSKREKALVLCSSDSTIYAIFFPERDFKHQLGTISEKIKCSTSTTSYLTAKFNIKP